MKAVLTYILVLSQLVLFAKRTPISIEKAIKQGLVTIDIKGKGGYSGNCIQIKLQSKHNDSLYLILEAGRKLNSLNNEEQDILITKEQLFTLKKMETKTIDAYGFCCQASNHSPVKDSKFSIGKMSDSSLTALAQFCNKNKFSTGDIQSSVWCISDDVSIASIPGNNEKLRKFVSTVKHEEIPWYQKEYVPSTGTQPFSNRANKITGNITYTTVADDYMNIQLMDANGQLVQKFTDKKLVEKGTYDYWFELQVTNWPKGKYFIHIYSGDQLLSKKEFKI